ncbi:MAG TPA: amidase [Spirochaetia bacterium]|nr:amidase [Spirochaetia bacterium]
MEDLGRYDAVGLGELVRRGKISPEELLDYTIRRIEAVNPRLNAVVCPLWEQARAEAKKRGEERAGPGERFPGVPYLLKDLVTDMQGAPFADGSRFVRGHVSAVDSELVRRSRASGLVIAGRTNTSELGVLTTAEPLLYGPTHNPWNLGLTTGGSSGGSAAAVAAGMVPMAHGNDGGGSIRIPASCCGVFGLKPTRGRNSLGPLFGDLAGGIVCEHALTRTVRDSAALLDATSGMVAGDPYAAPPPARPFLEETRRSPGRLKIAFLSRVPDGWNQETALHPDCAAAVRDAAGLCESLGHGVEEADPAAFAWPDLPQRFITIFSSMVGHSVAYWERTLGKKVTRGDLEPVTWDLYEASQRITGPAYLETWEELQRFSRKIARWYCDGAWDILLSPTMQVPPTALGSFEPSPDDPGSSIRLALSFVAFTRTQNVTGDPAMSVPLYWNRDNVPIGVQFAAPYGREGTLFRLAAQLEKARPWAERRPPVHCG